MPEQGDSPPQGRVAAAYDEHTEMLWFVARKFNLPDSDILPLIHDVFVAFMRHESTIGNPRSWLVAATCNACRNYWRDKRSSEPILDSLPAPNVLADVVTASIDVARVLAKVPSRCRTVLLLRYRLGLDPEEIAVRCATSDSPAYGRQMVHRCMRAARAALARMVRL